jgi:hypothetical protein
MVRHVAWAFVVASAACGTTKPDPNAPDQMLAALEALPNVNDVTEVPTMTAGYTYYVLHFVQPTDHADPASPTFLQEVSLLHKDVAAPLVIQTSGYWDYYLDSPVELTEILGANQISIEHRFFGASRPDPADWSKLTIEQMADDEHAIVQALGTIYQGTKLATGGSKGGMTAIYYRRFFPDDVDGTVPYVAPISYAELDPRYPPFLAQVGDGGCRAQVRADAVEMLQNRRAALVAAATAQAMDQGYAYTRIPIGPAVEGSVVSLEWAFWQYFGEDYCAQVPSTTDADANLFAFLDMISPVSGNDDAEVAAFEAYDYQAYAQLGYPDDGTDAYLKPYEMYDDHDFSNALPLGVAMPAYDGGAAMHDIDDYVETGGDRLLFEYGQWDPWSGGMFTLGNAADSAMYVEAAGTHDSELNGLETPDQDAVMSMLARWTGVAAQPGRHATSHVARLRVPRLHVHRHSP